MKPSAMLKPRIKALGTVEQASLTAKGIERRVIRRAAVGLQINASDYLRLCAFVGLDPMTGKDCDKRVIGPLHKPTLSLALRMKREDLKITLRQAAAKARMSYSALGRIERAEDVSIEAILKACRWLNRHPFDFVSPYVTRETEAERAA